jgi:Protein of unknown function (DUF732)
LVVIGAGIAHADPADNQFLADIDGIGVADSPAELIDSAHKVCTLYNYGESESQVDDAVIAAHRLWSEAQLVRFLVDAIEDYCPQYGPSGSH